MTCWFPRPFSECFLHTYCGTGMCEALDTHEQLRQTQPVPSRHSQSRRSAHGAARYKLRLVMKAVVSFFSCFFPSSISPATSCPSLLEVSPDSEDKSTGDNPLLLVDREATDRSGHLRGVCGEWRVCCVGGRRAPDPRC